MKKIRNIIIQNKKIVTIILALIVAALTSIQLNINSSNFLEIDAVKFIVISVVEVVLLPKTFLKKFSDKNNYHKILLAIILTICTMIGKSYAATNSWDLILNDNIQFIKALLCGIGYYIFIKSVIDYVFDIVTTKINYKPKKSKVFNFIFEKHPFILPFLIIICLWIPYIFAYYPGIIMQDSREQIKQYYGYDVVGATDSVNLIDENQKITNHHPVAHTLLLGSLIKLGSNIKNENFGVFLYTMLQVITLASAFACIIKYMKKLKTPNYIRVLTLIAFGVLPVFPFYAIKIVKDTLFSAIFIFYLIVFFDIFFKAINKEKYKLIDVIKIIVVAILLCLTRNNGIYNVLLSLPLLLLVDKVNRKKIMVVIVFLICAYEAYTKLLFPALKIPNASVREALSIPFQQTARYVSENEQYVTEEEKNAIDKVLTYDSLSNRYNPVHADSVKNKFNKNTTSDDLKEYFGVWFKQFTKSPTTYVQATINNTYGYFYPGSKATSYIASYSINANKDLKRLGVIDYHYNKYKKLRKNIDSALKILEESPIISLVINIGFNTWLVFGMTSYLLYKKKYKYLVCIAPTLSIILVCFASPANAYFRYAIPYLFSMPLLISMFIKTFQKECTEESNEENRVEVVKNFKTIIKEHLQYKHQILKLAKADLVKTYRGAALGWSWAIIKPTVTIFVYWFAFAIGLRMSKDVGQYPFFLWLIAGVVPWFYMSDMITGGADAIRKYSYLVTKMKFPISTIPTFVNISKFIVHVILLLITIGIFMMFGFKPDVYLLQLPFYMIIMFLFFNLWGLFASLLAAISKDFLNLVRAFVTAIFWLSGIIWDADTVTIPWLKRFLNLNPVTFIVNGYRNCLINKIWFWEQPKRIGYVIIFITVMLVSSLWAYRKLRKEIPDVL